MPIKRTLPTSMCGTYSRNVPKGRRTICLILLAFLINLMPACSSGLTNTPTIPPAAMSTQHAQSLILSGTVLPGTRVPSPLPLERTATFVENYQKGLLDSTGTIAACMDPNLDYLIERMGTFDPNSMSQIIQAKTFQDVDGSTRTVMEKLKIAVEFYNVDTSQFVFLYVPNNIMFSPTNIYNQEIGQCLALIYIPDPAALIPLFSGN